MEALLKKAEGGDAKAMYHVGVLFKIGTEGFKKDRSTAFSWFKKAHEAGSVPGTAVHGGCLCYDGYHQTGMMYMGIAAAQGSDYAAYELGMAFADGKFNTRVNRKDAIHWLKKADGTCEFLQLTKESIPKAKMKLEELQESDNGGIGVSTAMGEAE